MKQERSQNIRKAMEELEKINGKGNGRRKYVVRIGVPGVSRWLLMSGEEARGWGCR